ncbi:IS110 family transposase [Bosea sp. BK604]|uniref:IS110 family transposase n=1 Tax=Bosea sp. BK604 TaxID=2512180 RepID=UPI001053C25A|nr:IS110 family transposase [Bosea sp. BK604]TCR59288.1 transposase [Bosea sp. BK604]
MTDLACAAGIDVGRDHLDFSVAPQGHCWRVRNEPAGIATLVARLRRHGVIRVALEAIGPYAERLIQALAGAGIAVGAVDPRRIKAWRTAEGRLAKNDRLDAALIARFALLMPDIVRPVPDRESRALRALSTRRRQIVEMIAMEKTRLKQALDAEIAASHRSLIARLAEERQHIEAELEARLCAGEQAERFTLLQSAPGVGPAIAITLMADLPELDRLDRRALASLAGLAPQISQSGAGQPSAHIAGGRPCVRSALYLAALSAARLDHGYKAEYQAMRLAGKPAKVALVAIARKLLVALSSMARQNRPWQDKPPSKT